MRVRRSAESFGRSSGYGHYLIRMFLQPFLMCYEEKVEQAARGIACLSEPSCFVCPGGDFQSIRIDLK